MRTWTLVVGLMLAGSSIAQAEMQDPAQGDSKVAAEKAAKEATITGDRQSSHSDRQNMRSGLENMRGGSPVSHTATAGYMQHMSSGGHSSGVSTIHRN